MSQETFPQTQNDPFNQVTSKDVEPSSWQPESHAPRTVAPRWTLQTPEERIEHENTVKKLESKLQKLKQRPDNHYSYKRIPDASQSLLSSESDNEDDYDHDDQIEQEHQEEGLPLLWKTKSTSLQDTPKKTEDQYFYRPWRFISCCFSC